MAGGSRINTGDVFKEVQALREDIQKLSTLLIGCTDEPDKPGLVERVRILEGAAKLVRWVSGIIVMLIISDVVTQLIKIYRGVP